MVPSLASPPHQRETRDLILPQRNMAKGTRQRSHDRVMPCGRGRGQPPAAPVAAFPSKLMSPCQHTCAHFMKSGPGWPSCLRFKCLTQLVYLPKAICGLPGGKHLAVPVSGGPGPRGRLGLQLTQEAHRESGLPRPCAPWGYIAPTSFSVTPIVFSPHG